MRTRRRFRGYLSPTAQAAPVVGCQRRTAGGKRSGAVRGSYQLRPADHYFHPVLGPRVLWRSPGSAPVHGHPQGGRAEAFPPDCDGMGGDRAVFRSVHRHDRPGAVSHGKPALATASGAENVFIVLSQGLLPAVLAGIIMAGILAATISSSDSYLLIAASAFSKNIYEES